VPSQSLPPSRALRDYWSFNPFGVLGGAPGFHLEHLSAPERLVTFEGEHAAFLTARGTQDGRPVLRALGFVLGDDFCAVLHGVCPRKEEHDRFTALVRTLTKEDAHVLGIRRRRFEYLPPDDWEPLVQGFITEWIPPDYPGNQTVLTVYPANPIGLVDRASLDLIVKQQEQIGAVVETLAGSEVAANRHGLTGLAHGLTLGKPGQPSVRKEVIVLEDDRFTYALEITSSNLARWAAHRALLHDVAAGVVPVPHWTAHAAAAGLLSHWLF